MGLTADIGAAIAVPAAVTLLSAVLAIATMRCDARQAQPSCSDNRARPGLWARWAARIARSRWLEGPATAILVLLLLAIVLSGLGSRNTRAKGVRVAAENHGADCAQFSRY